MVHEPVPCSERNATLYTALEHGHTYHCLISATNGAGLRAQAISDAVQVDLAPSGALRSAISHFSIYAPSGALANLTMIVNGSVDLEAEKRPDGTMVRCNSEKCWSTPEVAPIGPLEQFEFQLLRKRRPASRRSSPPPARA